MAKKNKNMVGIEKIEKKEVTFRKELETYLVFGLIILFVGIFIGTTASAISIYNGNKDDALDLGTTKMIEAATPEENEDVSVDELDLDEIEKVEGAEQPATDVYQPIYPE